MNYKQASEWRTSKSSLFRCFPYSDVRCSDPHYIRESSFRIVTVQAIFVSIEVSWNSYQISKFIQLWEAASESFRHGQISDGQVSQVPHWLEQSQTPLRIVNLKMIQLNLKLVKCMLTLELRCIPVLGWGVLDFFMLVASFNGLYCTLHICMFFKINLHHL